MKADIVTNAETPTENAGWFVDFFVVDFMAKLVYGTLFIVSSRALSGSPWQIARIESSDGIHGTVSWRRDRFR